jgi:hypothetical protein
MEFQDYPLDPNNKVYLAQLDNFWKNESTKMQKISQERMAANLGGK